MKLFLVVAFLATAAATDVASCQTCNDGRTLAGGTGCFCGTNAVFIADDEYCLVTPTAQNANGLGYKLTAPLCANTDGTAAATAACQCGENAEAIAIGEYCFITPLTGVGIKSAAAKTACANTTGTDAIGTTDCYCGSNAADATADAKFCYVPSANNTDGLGAILDETLCANTTGGGGSPAAACRCGTDAAGTGQGAQVSTSQRCVFKENSNEGVMINQDADIAACASDKRDGKTGVGTKCYCGSNRAYVADTGHYCFWPSTNNPNNYGVDMDNVKICANTTGGGGSPAAACKCGTNAAGTGTGADVSTSQRCVFKENSNEGVMINQDADIAACASDKRDGRTGVGTKCYCGSNRAYVSDTGHYCFWPSTNNPDNYGVDMDNVKICANTTGGGGSPAAACKCGTNAAGTGTGADVSTSQRCVFKKDSNEGVMIGQDADIAECASDKRDGRTGVGTKCYCGSNRAYVADTAHFCYVPSASNTNEYGVDMDNVKMCDVTDGSANPDVACKCGTDAAGTGAGVDVTTSQYCWIPSGTTKGIMLASPLCDNTDAQTSPTAACRCGEDGSSAQGAATTTSQFCFYPSAASNNTGQMKAAAVKPAGTCVAATATGSPAGTTAPGIFAALAAVVAMALRM